VSNVIKFQKPSSSRGSKDNAGRNTGKQRKAVEERDQINQRIAALGGEAIESLGRWRTGLPIDDRVRLARNMDGLIREYKVKPGKLDWESYGYRDKESFNRDLSRMRLPETAEPGRRLLAHNTRWLHLLEMVQLSCTHSGEGVTLEALAERLTRGTRFHPTKKINSRAEKLLYSLKLWANEVDEKHGLLTIYRRIAEARAEHFELYMRDYDEKSPDSFSINAAIVRPLDAFTNIPDENLPLFSRQLDSYTDEDWDVFFSITSEESHQYYSGLRDDIDSWKPNFNPETTLFAGWTGEGTPSLSGNNSMEYLPSWFCGFYDSHDFRLLSQYQENTGWPTIFSYKTGTLDPEGRRKEYAECGEGFVYLTLYPNAGLSRLVPYLFSFTEEWSTFECLEEHHLTSGLQDKLFPPVGRETEAIARELQSVIEDDYPQIREQWMNTAENLKSHPLLIWSEGRELMIDAEIERLTTGNQSTNKKDERND
jgi:hypothetical protein